MQYLVTATKNILYNYYFDSIQFARVNRPLMPWYLVLICPAYIICMHLKRKHKKGL